MNYHKLISLVHSYPALYDYTTADYSNIKYKLNVWQTIGQELNESSLACKKAWICLRDSYRRSLRKKIEAKKDPLRTKRLKKWRFEDQMSFLLDHFQNDFKGDLADTRTTSTVIKPKVEERSILSFAIEDSQDSQNVILSANSDTLSNTITTIKACPIKKTPSLLSLTSTDFIDSAPKIVDFDEYKAINDNVVDAFFASISQTVKTFTPFRQNLIKQKIFSIVSTMELEEITERGYTAAGCT